MREMTPEEDKDKYHFFWQDPALVTSDSASLEKDRNLIASIFGNSVFINATIQNIAFSYNIDNCAIDFIDLLNSSRQAFSVWSDKFLLSSSTSKKRTNRGLLVIRNAEQIAINGDNLSELSELDILFRLTDKSSPYSNVLTLVTFKIDDLSILHPTPSSSSTTDTSADTTDTTGANSSEFDWKAYLTDKWRPSFVEFNPTALIGRMSRAAIQSSDVYLPCPPLSPSVEDASIEQTHLTTKCEIISSIDPKCHHVDSLLVERFENVMASIRKQFHESTNILTNFSWKTLYKYSTVDYITAGPYKSIRPGQAHSMQVADAVAMLGLLLLIVMLLRRVLFHGSKKKRVKIVLPTDGTDINYQNSQTHPTSALKKPRPTLTPGPKEVVKAKKVVAFQSETVVDYMTLTTEQQQEQQEKVPIKKGRVQRVQTPAAKSKPLSPNDSSSSSSTPSSKSVVDNDSVRTPVVDISEKGKALDGRTYSTRSRSPGTPHTRSRTRGGKATPAKSDDFIYT